MERRALDPTFTDHLTADLGGPRTSRLLTELDQFIPWADLCAPLAVLYGPQPKGGRQPWPVVLMVKCLLLQRWFHLSDPQLEEQLRDRLSFRRFVGLSLADATPDETTFVVFRRRLRERGLEQALFDQALALLTARGLVVREGTLVDATLLHAPRGGRSAAGADGERRGDPDATTTVKGGQIFHGYKAHVACDPRGLITGCTLDTAKVHDSRHFLEFVPGAQGYVAADSAYWSRAHEAALRERGLIPALLARRVRGQAQLDPVDALGNRVFAGLRAPIEHVFARLKQTMGYRRVRYRGLARNQADLTLTALAYNFRRALALAPT